MTRGYLRNENPQKIPLHFNPRVVSITFGLYKGGAMPLSPPAFLIGVFSQPVSSFAKWKARGINTLVLSEPEGGRVKKEDWEAAATAAGLFFMDYPSDDDALLPNEAKQTHRLAFMQNDEPDMTRQPNTSWPNPDGWTKPEIL